MTEDNYLPVSAITNQGLIFEYIKLYTGQSLEFSNVYFSPGNPGRNHEIAMRVMRLAIEDFMHWSPEDIAEKASSDMIRIMRLEPVYRYLIFPPELDKARDYWFLGHLLYPDDIPFDLESLTIKTYKRLLSNVTEGPDRLVKWPKKYFDDNFGRKKAGICLLYMISHFENFYSTEDMYSFFASSGGRSELKKYGLDYPCNKNFSSSVNFLHQSLPEEQRDEFLYHYYEFQLQFQKQERIDAKFVQQIVTNERREKRREKKKKKAEEALVKQNKGAEASENCDAVTK